MREEHEIALQRQQGQIEDELKKERDDQLRLEDELDRVKEETEDRVCKYRIYLLNRALGSFNPRSKDLFVNRYMRIFKINSLFI